MTLGSIILVPLICGTIFVNLLLLFICCTKHLEHELDDDDILELSTIEHRLFMLMALQKKVVRIDVIISYNEKNCSHQFPNYTPLLT